MSLKRGKLVFFGIEINWFIKKIEKYKGNVAFNKNSTKSYKVHIGPGASWVKPDDSWLTVDADPVRGDIVFDFNKDDFILPIPDKSVQCIYASHVFEHISIYKILKVIRECNRCLVDGGILRVIVPNPSVSINEYVNKNVNFPLFKRRIERAKTVTGENYTIFEAMKEDFISKSNQAEVLGIESLAHQNAWDFESLKMDLIRGGFSENNIIESSFKDVGSSCFEFEGKYASEANECYRSLYVEAKK